jgi:hypothetical protein
MRSLQFPWDIEPAPAVKLPLAEVPAPKPKPKGRRARDRYMAHRPHAEPDWLHHHLTISGPAETVNNFAAVARGSGVIPWQLDFAAIEEDVFVRAVSQPARDRKLTVAGCRILARQFREKVEAHQARAAALVGHSFACPFDLHALLPVPSELLLLGPTHPTALSWLAAHWGITDRLRQVVVRDKATTGRRLPQGHAVIGYGFFTDGETPQAAIDAIATRWPTLRFWLVPRPAE